MQNCDFVLNRLDFKFSSSQEGTICLLQYYHTSNQFIIKELFSLYFFSFLIAFTSQLDNIIWTTHTPCSLLHTTLKNWGSLGTRLRFHSTIDKINEGGHTNLTWGLHGVGLG